MTTTRFDLQPDHHLRRVEEGWEAFGNDPCFHCLSDAFPLAAGWYAFNLDLQRLAGPAMWAFLYPDYGQGASEETRVFLPFAAPGDRFHRGIARLSHPARGLRFDPAVAVCRFGPPGLTLEPVSRWVAARHMLRMLARRDAPLATRVAWFAGLARSALGGTSAFAQRLYDLYAAQPADAQTVAYETWVQMYDTPDAARLADARAAAAKLAVRPRISIVLPVYDTDEKWLRHCIDSVLAQTYPEWELCIADDASPSPHVRRVLAAYAAADNRIKVVHRPTNGHISASSNTAIGLATGDWMALLDHDDELHPLALQTVVESLQANPRWRVVYSDEDKIDERGRRFDPYMKPDWNYDLLLAHNCVSHLGVYDMALVREVGGFREGMEGSQDWDLALRCIERLGRDQIGHVPGVLYHWRAIDGSTALAPQEKDYAHVAGLRTIAEHLERSGSAGRVEEIPGQRGNYRVRYAVPDPAPFVSIIVPTRDGLTLLRACIESVLSASTYPNFEIVVVDNQSRKPETLEYLARVQADPRVRVLAWHAPFNYSAINNFAVSRTRGELVCLLNNDITVITPGWLEEMVGHAVREDVGAVGAMLYYPNDTIQHAGVIIGAHGIAAHAYSGRRRGDPGMMSRARLVQQMSAVTAACLVVRRTVYEAASGLDESLQVAFNDVDFCLRLEASGYRNVWTPYAELYHHESASRGYEDSPEKQARFRQEIAYMRARWGARLSEDPAYSPNLTLEDRLHEFAFPPRTRLAHDAARPPSAP